MSDMAVTFFFFHAAAIDRHNSTWVYLGMRLTKCRGRSVFFHRLVLPRTHRKCLAKLFGFIQIPHTSFARKFKWLLKCLTKHKFHAEFLKKKEQEMKLGKVFKLK